MTIEIQPIEYAEVPADSPATAEAEQTEQSAPASEFGQSDGNTIEQDEDNENQEAPQDDTLAESEVSEFGHDQLIEEIFRRTKIQVPPNDPIVRLFLYMNEMQQEIQDNHKLFLINHNKSVFQELQQKYDQIQKQQLDQITAEFEVHFSKLTDEQKEVTIIFDNQLIELQKLFEQRVEQLSQLLKAVDKAKDSIVQDVWLRLKTTIDEQMKDHLNELAKAANTEQNKQINMLIGGGFGLAVGFIMMVIVLMIR